MFRDGQHGLTFIKSSQCIVSTLLISMSLTACMTTSKAKSKSNPVQQAANSLIGQPVNRAISVFGPPYIRIPAGNQGGSVMWENSRISKQAVQRFVQTGTEYAGQRVVGQTGGQGVIGAIYENVYRPTGYYQNSVEDRVDYACNISAMSDRNDIITDILVIGCKETKDGL